MYPCSSVVASGSRPDEASCPESEKLLQPARNGMKISGKSSSVVRASKWSAKQKLLKGALLGELVEQITGKDARIVRFDFRRSRRADGMAVCRHQAKSYAGRTLVGIAQVQWTGPLGEYQELLRRRMRTVLKRRKATPVILSTRGASGTIRRKFSLRLGKGQLQIEEQISFGKLDRLKQQTVKSHPCASASIRG